MRSAELGRPPRLAQSRLRNVSSHHVTNSCLWLRPPGCRRLVASCAASKESSSASLTAERFITDAKELNATGSGLPIIDGVSLSGTVLAEACTAMPRSTPLLRLAKPCAESMLGTTCRRRWGGGNVKGRVMELAGAGLPGVCGTTGSERKPLRVRLPPHSLIPSSVLHGSPFEPAAGLGGAALGCAQGA